MNDKRGASTPERVALNAACVAWILFIIGTGGVLCGLSTSLEAVPGAAPAALAVEPPPDVWATDGDTPDAGPLIARPMPAEPFEGQKRPPCAKYETAIQGGCWAELARKPDEDNCGQNGFAHGGKCYVPVRKAKRLPTSVMP